MSTPGSLYKRIPYITGYDSPEKNKNRSEFKPDKNKFF
jgi:hypothetical protein